MNRIKNIDYFVLLLLLAVAAYPVYMLTAHYLGGDQTHYRRLYGMLADADNVFEVFRLTKLHVGSGEIVSPLILWFGSYFGIDKDIYIAFWNLVLLGVIYLACRHYRLNPVLILLILTNYYLIVLFAAAERLKLGYLFAFLIPFCSTARLRYAVILASCLSHFQMIIFYLGLFCYFNLEGYLKYAKSILASPVYLFLLVLLMVAALVGLQFTGLASAILGKGSIYASGSKFALSALMQFALLTICFIWAMAGRIEARAVYLIVFFGLSIVVLGGDRVNMIYFTAAFFVLMSGGHIKPGSLYSWPIVALLIYFSVKSIGFVEDVFRYGQGYF